MNAVSQWADILAPENKAAAIEALQKAFDHPSVEIRRRAGVALGQLGVKGLSGRIIGFLRKDSDGSYQYIEALGLQGDDEALQVILEYAAHSNQFLRKATVLALRNFKSDQRARLALEESIKDPQWEVRMHAIESLEKIGDTRSVPALVGALRDENPLIVRVAVRVVSKLGDDATAPPLLELLKSGDEETRKAVSIYIGELRLKNPNAVGDVLLQMLDSPSAEVRASAIGGLAKLRDKRAIPKLAKIAQESAALPATDMWSIMTVRGAVYALGEMKDPAAIPELVTMLDDARLNEAACEALANLGDPAAAKPLFDHYVRTAGASDQWRSRSKEMKALGEIGTVETVAALQDYLSRCPPPEKRSVRQAIETIQKRITP